MPSTPSLGSSVSLLTKENDGSNTNTYLGKRKVPPGEDVFHQTAAAEILKEEEDGVVLLGNQIPKTKIVCTLGPASRSVEMIGKLLNAGMSVARFNFSHGSHEYHQETLDNLRLAMKNTGIPCAVMLDTKGPEIRTGHLKDGKPIELKQGQEITLTTDYTVDGDDTHISISYHKLATDVSPGSTILCSDGTVTLTVLHCDKDSGLVRCRCENSAVLGERKNVNLPGVVVDLPTLTEKDKVDILGWGVPNKVDIIALSFVRKGCDVVMVRELLGEHAKNIVLMSKVENQEGVDNLDEILASSDAFMVARGDLGMEIPIEKIFLAQKVMIHKCNAVGKPVVTATQMLESMIKCPRPTRAEATDVANAVIDGTDCVMLSGETAAGAYAEEAVRTMAKICLEAEKCLNYAQIFKKALENSALPMNPLESLACAAVQTANSAKAAMVLVLSKDANAAKLLAKYRPSMPILSVMIGDDAPASHGLIYRGIVPVSISELKADGGGEDEVTAAAIGYGKEKQLCHAGHTVVVTSPENGVINVLTIN
ncbi:PREDICTED: probable pyruvate kinase, cytosolic isozyme [Ipomoea nil]|uniref:probable pyruvate kinase, cytosolic isozyme n=1 Tax=Ipomoea nil TaxID=35883 RepID=UPI0009012D6B|nr:PREDICTED: probable pyruvate kinase, cytosolic isozyme [Ipomoea nil]